MGARRERRRSSRFGISLLLPEPPAGIPPAPLDAASPSRLQSPFPGLVIPFFLFLAWLGSVSLPQPGPNPTRIVCSLLVTPGHAGP